MFKKCVTVVILIMAISNYEVLVLYNLYRVGVGHSL